MLTLRALPGRDDADNVLIAAYHGGLARHWSPGQRLVGYLLAKAGMGGWSPTERRLLDADIRVAGLSMAARKGVHRLLNPAAFPLAHNPLKNKQIFAAQARNHRLPVPETFNPEAGLTPWLAGQSDIIAKPSYQSKGRGVQRFLRAEAGWRAPGVTLTDRGLAARLAPLVAAGGVIQQCLPTHAELADISPGALPTLRVVTCLNEAGVPEVCGVALRLSAGGRRPVDNFNAGNLVLPVNAGRRCGAAYWNGGGDRSARHDRHPATGAMIAGRAVPDHAAALTLTIRAHVLFRSGFTVIGWDVGLTDAGPVLIEGNWNPGTDILQLVEGQGTGRTRLGDLYRHHLGALPAERWRNAGPVQREPRLP